MAKEIMAWRPGIFRCSGIGQIKYAEAGETLPAHTGCGEGCEWEFKEEDNFRPDKATVIIGNGPFFVIIIDKVPRVGDILNLKFGLDGRFQVTKLGTITRDDAEETNRMVWPCIMVERVGDHEEGRLVYQVGSIGKRL